MQHLEAYIQESFAPLLQHCSQILGEKSDVDAILTGVLLEATALLQDLPSIRKYVQPCFPANYNITQWFCTQYHSQFVNVIDLVALSGSRLSNGDILRVMKWITEYNCTLVSIAPKSSDCQFGGRLKV